MPVTSLPVSLSAHPSPPLPGVGRYGPRRPLSLLGLYGPITKGNTLFYIDNENSHVSDPMDAAETFVTLETAQSRAVELSKRYPGVEYYVNEPVTTINVVFRSVATITVESQVIEPPVTV